MITMDPWPQKIYLDAIGQLTVSEYVNRVSQEYPKNQVPEQLDFIILEMLQGLINEEKIISLSDKPFELDDLILNPQTKMGEIDLIGVWKGNYEYELAEHLNLQSVNFTITIEKVKGNVFKGTVQDDLANGGTPGIGLIKGEFDGDRIKFTKKMPVSATIDRNGNRQINEKKKHTPLFYEGEFSRSKKSILGTWKFNKRIYFWKGILPFRASAGNGTFTMNKELKELKE